MKLHKELLLLSLYNEQRMSFQEINSKNEMEVEKETHEATSKKTPEDEVKSKISGFPTK
jgi:hypothetical protein